MVDMNGHSANGEEASATLDDNLFAICPDPIAICGMAFRLPGGCNDDESFWDFLINKRDARGRIPPDRFNVDAFHSATPKTGTTQSQYGYFLESDIFALDTAFFSVTKSELLTMDPQQRLLLEVTRECLENAGESDWRGKQIGCYVGTFGEDWSDIYARDIQESAPYRLMGYSDFAIANRVSYEFDFRGPSMSIGSACSSALVGLHQACGALRSGECTSAIVAGTSIILTPTVSIAMSEQGVLSPDGSCKTFDAAANGYARAEAINAVYLKPLDAALKDGSPIRAVIRASSVNFDGKTVNITSPSTDTQENLIRQVYKTAKMNPYDTTFVECHGTGTPVGDPIEIAAIARCFNNSYIGSVKPNFGHSEGASGITSVIKSVLALEKNMIPPNIKFYQPNPNIHFEEWGLRVPTEPVTWPQGRHHRISINSFGIGGTNAHVILDASPLGRYCTNGPFTRLCSDPHLLLLSAHQSNSLKQLVKDNRQYASVNRETIHDHAYTLATRREHLPRRAFCVSTSQELKGPVFGTQLSKRRKLLMVFTGQGAQWPEMGKSLLRKDCTFRRTIQLLDAHLATLLHAPAWSISDELQKPSIISRLHLAEFSQPLCTAIQIALVDVFRELGVRPTAVVGHSSGEIAAGYAAGSLSREDAITIAYYRGSICRQLTKPGSMAAVGLSWDEMSAFLEPGVVIACDNSASSVTISGDADAVKSCLAKIKSERPGVLARELQVDRAYHSHHMLEVGDQYRQYLEGIIQPRTPAIPFFSSVTRGHVSFDVHYWQANLESPVLFKSAASAVVREFGDDILFLEVGPHPALAGPLRQTCGRAVHVASLRRGENAEESLQMSLGNLWLAGVVLDFRQLMPSGNILTDLPKYPWNHETSQWHESRLASAWRLRKFPHHELLGSRVTESPDTEPVWRNMLRLDKVSWLRDHKIREDVVMPFAAYMAMVIEAVRQVTGLGDGFDLRNCLAKKALVLQDAKSCELVTSLRRAPLTDQAESDWYVFGISVFSGNGWVKHCTGQVRNSHAPITDIPESLPCPREVSAARWYETLRNVGLNYGPEFSLLQQVVASPTTTSARAMTKNIPGCYLVHPATVDQILQLFSVSVSQGQSRKFTKLTIPTAFEEIRIRPGAATLEVEASGARTHKGHYVGSACARDSSNGETLVSMVGVRLSAVKDDTPDADPHAMAQLVWQPAARFLKPDSLIQRLPSRAENMRLVDRLAALCILEICQKLQPQIVTLLSGDLRKYCDWMQRQTNALGVNTYPLISDGPELVEMSKSQRSAQIESLVTRLKRVPQGVEISKGIMALYSNSDAMVNGDTDPLMVLLRDGILKALYTVMNNIDQTPYLNALAHEKPCMRILEVGAGTGAATHHVLEALLRDCKASYETYVYTDVSAGFLPAAKERFAHAPGIEYKVLDISGDPVEQGFEEGSFDLVIATNVLHTTSSLEKTLRNVRSLLRPDGRLLLNELCPVGRWVNFIFGALPGWWNGAGDDRADEPFVTPDRWEKEMHAVGLEMESVVYDDVDEARLNALMVARPNEDCTAAEVIFLVEKESSRIRQLLQKFEHAGHHVQVFTLEDDFTPDRDVISLLDYEAPFFDRLSTQRFDALRKLISRLGKSGHGLIWVTKPTSIDADDPRYAQALGFARVIRSEMIISVATLEIDEHNLLQSNALLQVFEAFRDRGQYSTELDPDFEYLFHNKQLHIGRYHPVRFDDVLLDKQARNKSARLHVGQYGMLSSLQWLGTESESLRSDEIEVETKSIGLNFKDVLVAMGVVESQQPGLGLEAAGIVSKVGSSVEGLTVGDRVMCLGAALFASHIRTIKDLCVKIPHDLSFEDATTMPCVYATVIRALCDVGQLREGQSVLIHSAAGGVGLAAIQISQMIGAEIFVSVGNDEKIDFLVQCFGIARDRVFHSRDASFREATLKATGGKGVDIVLNSLSGELLHTSWRCVAPFGKMIEIGKRDLIGRGALALDVFEANRMYAAIDLSAICSDRPDLAQSLLERIVEYHRKGHIKPIPIARTFDAEEIEHCFRYMQKGEHIGKIVVSIPQTVTTHGTLDDLALDPSGSYLLVGGMGGLGRGVATWMAEHGARTLIFLSPNAGMRQADFQLTAELEHMGCCVHAVAGRVESMEDVQKALTCAPGKVKGVLQMSMFLRDQTFLQMSHKEWQDAVACKVQGTWNLHNATREMDFFVLFSSISGIIGNRGQANYAAANTFLDAFVPYRRALGLPCSTIDVGLMEDIGAAQHQAQLVQQLKAYGNHPLHEQQLLDALKLAIIDKSGGPLPVVGVRSTIPLSSPQNRVIWKRDPRFAWYHHAHLHQSGDGEATASSSSMNAAVSVLLKVGAADPSIFETSSTHITLARAIGGKIMELLLKPIGEDGVDDSVAAVSISELGVDSLIAIEVRNWWRQALGVEISMLDLLSSGTVGGLGKKAAKLLSAKYGGKA